MATQLLAETGPHGPSAGTLDRIENMNGEEALAKLLEGNRRFLAGAPEAKNFVTRREELKSGQQPIATVVACSDSRVVPEYIFDVGLGEIFKVESAGNVLDKVGLGSVEYGVGHLHTPLLVVMGHQGCGAVTAAYDCGAGGDAPEGNIAAIVKKLAPVIKKAKKGGEKSAEIEQASAINVKKVMGKLRKLPPLKAALESGALKMVGMKYSLDGTVEIIVKK